MTDTHIADQRHQPDLTAHFNVKQFLKKQVCTVVIFHGNSLFDFTIAILVYSVCDYIHPSSHFTL